MRQPVLVRELPEVIVPDAALEHGVGEGERPAPGLQRVVAIDAEPRMSLRALRGDE